LQFFSHSPWCWFVADANLAESRLKHISSSYCCTCNATNINRAQEVMSETCRRWTTSTSLPPWAPQTPDLRRTALRQQSSLFNFCHSKEVTFKPNKWQYYTCWYI
jgi:hypothetical protein